MGNTFHLHSTFANEKKINVKTAIVVYGFCGIIITFKAKNTKEHKMKTGILNTFKIKKNKKAENGQNMGIISTVAKMEMKH